MQISPTLTTALAIAALLIPAAGASAQPPDMHASTAIAAAKAQQQQKQDLRSPDARDAAIHPRGPGHAVNALPQAPTWPVDPKPIATAPASQPAATGDDGINWGTIAIGVGLSLIAVAGFALVANRRRGGPRMPASV